jgi:hypothetical protein
MPSRSALYIRVELQMVLGTKKRTQRERESEREGRKSVRISYTSTSAHLQPPSTLSLLRIRVCAPPSPSFLPSLFSLGILFASFTPYTIERIKRKQGPLHLRIRTLFPFPLNSNNYSKLLLSFSLLNSRFKLCN